MAKKSDYAVVTDALAQVREYNQTIHNCIKFLKDEKIDASMKVTLEASQRMATENRDSAVGTIFRRAAEHVGGDEKSLTTFIQKVFAPVLLDEVK